MTNYYAENAATDEVLLALRELFRARKDRALKIEPGTDFLTGRPNWLVSMDGRHVVDEDLGRALTLLKESLPSEIGDDEYAMTSASYAELVKRPEAVRDLTFAQAGRPPRWRGRVVRIDDRLKPEQEVKP